MHCSGRNSLRRAKDNAHNPMYRRVDYSDSDTRLFERAGAVAKTCDLDEGKANELFSKLMHASNVCFLISQGTCLGATDFASHRAMQFVPTRSLIDCKWGFKWLIHANKVCIWSHNLLDYMHLTLHVTELCKSIPQWALMAVTQASNDRCMQLNLAFWSHKVFEWL